MEPLIENMARDAYVWIVPTTAEQAKLLSEDEIKYGY